MEEVLNLQFDEIMLGPIGAFEVISCWKIFLAMCSLPSRRHAWMNLGKISNCSLRITKICSLLCRWRSLWLGYGYISERSSKCQWGLTFQQCPIHQWSIKLFGAVYRPGIYMLWRNLDIWFWKNCNYLNLVRDTYLKNDDYQFQEINKSHHRVNQHN